MDFQFSEKSEALDWGQVRTADLRLGDLNLLQPLLSHLACVSLDRSDITTLRDTKAVKAFRLAQLGLEALSASQRNLCAETQLLISTQKQIHSQTNFLQEEIEDQAKTLVRLEEEVARRTKRIEAQHLAAQQGVTASSLHSVMQLANTLKCQHCGKRFLSAHYLEAHIQRRHPPQLEPEPLLDTQLQQFRDYFTNQLKQVTEKSARDLELIQSHYEDKLPPPLPTTPPQRTPSLSSTSVEEFVAAQQQLRAQLAARPLPQPIVPNVTTEEDSGWLQRLETSLGQLVTDSIEKWKAAHPPEPEASPIQLVEAEELPPHPVPLIPERFYPESNILSCAGDVEDDEASPRPILQPHSQAGFIEEDECEAPEVEVIQLEEDGAAQTHLRTGQMTSLTIVPAIRRLTQEEIEQAVIDLGIDPNFESQNVFLARAMLLSHIGDWSVEQRGSQTCYKNAKTGHLSTSHPNLEIFQQKLALLKGRKWKHEWRDFLQAFEPHQLSTPRDSQASLLEHTSEDFLRTRELLRAQLFSAPTHPKPKPRPRPLALGSAGTIVQGFMEKLTVEQLLDSTDTIEPGIELIEGEIVVKGMIAPNDLDMFTTAEREIRHQEVSNHTIRRAIV